jgi:predicted TIM-barrel fold metal-dependent hydrolase
LNGNYFEQSNSQGLIAQPKIDCHFHILDPVRFPYAADVAYRPSGQEIGTFAQFQSLAQCYGIRAGLIVGPNSGYGIDNRCLLNALKQGQGRYKGIAVVPNNASKEQLLALKAQGVVGVAFNVALFGPDYYLSTQPLLKSLEALDMFLQIQVENEQLLALLPLIDSCGVKLLIDHCGRPSVQAGLQAKGFEALLSLGAYNSVSRLRNVVKLSGFQKIVGANVGGELVVAQLQPFVASLINAFGIRACVWASDWPFLKAASRIDYGPLLQLFSSLVPSNDEQQAILWDNPRRIFNFSDL